MYKKFFKRVFDFFLSLAALIVLSPVFLVLIILGCKNMKGNPFFTQDRPGKDEKIFKLIKFRSIILYLGTQILGEAMARNSEAALWMNFRS